MSRGLAIGQGLAQGFDNASKNFLASMNAVQEMKMKREKFNIDKKMSDLQMKKLEFDTDPVLHEQMVKENTLKLKAAESALTLSEFSVKKTMRTTGEKMKDAETRLKGFQAFALKFPDFADRMGMTADGDVAVSAKTRTTATTRKPADYAAYLKSITQPYTGKPLKGYEDDFAKAQKAYDDSMFGAPEMPKEEAAAGGGYQLDQIIEHSDGKKYKIVGLDDPENPDIEEVIDEVA